MKRALEMLGIVSAVCLAIWIIHLAITRNKWPQGVTTESAADSARLHGELADRYRDLARKHETKRLQHENTYLEMENLLRAGGATADSIRLRHLDSLRAGIRRERGAEPAD